MFKQKRKISIEATPEPTHSTFPHGIEEHLGLYRPIQRHQKQKQQIKKYFLQHHRSKEETISGSESEDEEEELWGPRESKEQLTQLEKKKLLNKIKIRGQSVVNTFSKTKESPRNKDIGNTVQSQSPKKIVIATVQQEIPDPSQYLSSVQKLIREIDQRNPKNAPPPSSSYYSHVERERMGAKSPVSIHQMKPIPKPKKKKKSMYRQISIEKEEELNGLLDVKTTTPQPKYKRVEDTEEEIQEVQPAQEERVEQTALQLPGINLRESEKYSDYESSFMPQYLNSPPALSPEVPDEPQKPKQSIVTHDISIGADFDEFDEDYEQIYDLEQYYKNEPPPEYNSKRLINPYKPNVHVRRNHAGETVQQSTAPYVKNVKPTVLNFPVQFDPVPVKHSKVGKGLKSNRKLSKTGKNLILRKGLNLVVRSNLSHEEMQAEARDEFVRRVLESGRYTDDEDLFRDYKNPQAPE